MNCYGTIKAKTIKEAESWKWVGGARIKKTNDIEYPYLVTFSDWLEFTDILKTRIMILTKALKKATEI